jgi:hypothetical protein
MILYLETNPNPKYIEKMIKEIQDRVNLIQLNGTLLNKRERREYLLKTNIYTLKQQLRTLKMLME